jgi:transposase
MARAGGEVGEQRTIISLRPLPGIPFGRGLRLVESDGQRAVVAGAAALHVWDAADKVAERVVIISLLRAKQTTQVELGPLLGYHRSTIGRLVDRVEQDGTAGLVQSKPGPKGPHKVTAEVLAVLDEGMAAGLGCVRLRRLVEERTGISLSTGHVCRLT